MNNHELKIEKNVAMPIFGYGSYKDIASKMDVGDSILFDKENQSIGFRKVMINNGMKAMARKQDGKIRVWRIK